MGLVKSKGNMYDWVTHTHTHLRGECPHGCKYCYVQAMERRYNGGHYKGELRLNEEALKVNYGSDKTIFIDNCNDLFAEGVETRWIFDVLTHCNKYRGNTYVFQSKNPKRMLDAISFYNELKYMVGTTIETDSQHAGIWNDNCPSLLDRIKVINQHRLRIKGPLFITIEPILKMDDPINFAHIISDLHPTFVNIGADSKGTGLPEPTAYELNLFISTLKILGVNIRKKVNLGRILEP